MAPSDFDRQNRESDRHLPQPPVHLHVHVNNSNDNSTRNLTVAPSFGDGGSDWSAGIFPLALVAILLAGMGLSSVSSKNDSGLRLPDCSQEFQKLNQSKVR